jgi:hypothetical protein
LEASKKIKEKKKKGKKKKGKKKKEEDSGWKDESEEDGGWSRMNQYRFTLGQTVQRFGGLPEDRIEYIPVVPADALPFQGYDGYFQDAYFDQ